jgi:hypothetical protein
MRLLQSARLIRYRRGHIQILDRPALEGITCECYAVVRHNLDKLFDCMRHSLPTMIFGALARCDQWQRRIDDLRGKPTRAANHSGVAFCIGVYLLHVRAWPWPRFFESFAQHDSDWPRITFWVLAYIL